MSDCNYNDTKWFCCAVHVFSCKARGAVSRTSLYRHLTVKVFYNDCWYLDNDVSNDGMIDDWKRVWKEVVIV